MAGKKHFVDINLNGNEVVNLKADTVLALPDPTINAKRVVFYNLEYYYSDGFGWSLLGNVIPPAGTTGQILAKVDGSDYNLEWIDNFTSQVKHEVKLGTAINKGQAVYISSADGTNMIVSKASNAAESTSSKTIGLLETSGALNDIVYVVTEGLLTGTGANQLDTSAATEGDPVWLGTDGNLLFGLANKPYAPEHLVFLGVVTRASATVGEIFVKVQNGFELQELHDVSVQNPVNNDLLTYDAFSGLWKSKPITASSEATELVTGGATWSGTGMVFDISTLTYTVDGVLYSTNPTTATLSVGDPTEPRFDAIVVNAAGTVYVIAGTPALNPTIPNVPTDVVLIQYVLVAAGATTPSVTNEYVYRENTSPDWTAASFAGSAPSLIANFASTFPTPFEGAQCTLIQAPTYSTSKYFQFTIPSGGVDRADYRFLAFRVYLPAAIRSRNVLVRLYNGATILATGVYATSWGLNMSTTGSWQLVVIPVAAFGSPTINFVTRVAFYITGNAANTFSAGYDRIAFDDIKFQTGYGPQSSVAKIDVQQGGTTFGSTAKLNFTGSGIAIITTTPDPLNNRIDINTSVNAIVSVENEGIPTTQSQILNFVGDGVSVAYDILSAKNVVTIAGNQGNTTYYLNQSVTQTPYKEFSSVKTAGSQVSTPYSVAGGATSIVGEYLTPSGIPGSTNLIGGLWAFYLHFTGTAGNIWTLFAEIYKRDSGGTETLLLTTDSVTASALSATPQMFYVDGVISSVPLSATDRILIRVKATNNDVTTNTINFVTEGNTYYSIANTTLNQSIPTKSYGHFYMINNSTDTAIGTTNTYQLITGQPSLDVESTDFVLNNPIDGAGTLLVDPAGDGGFENGATFALNGWTVVNSVSPTTNLNRWFLGAPGASSGLRGAFISNDGGVTNAYTVGNSSINHFYKDITIPAGISYLRVKFQVRVQGENPTTDYDYLRVQIVSTATTVTAGSLPAGGTIVGTFKLQGSNFVLQTVNLVRAGILTSSDIRLVFTWINDGSLGTPPPASVDQIEVLGFGGAGYLRYTGTVEKVFNASVNLNARSASANQLATIAIVKNANTSSIKSAMNVNLYTSGVRQMMSTQDTFRLAPNDTITPVIKNITGTNAILVEDINFIVKEK